MYIKKKITIVEEKNLEFSPDFRKVISLIN